MAKPEDILLQPQERLLEEINELDEKLARIEREEESLETQETSILQRVIENILPTLNKIYRSGIKFPIADTGHFYPEIVLFHDHRKKLFYTLTKNGEIMERDFVSPADVNLMPTWVFVSHYPMEKVIANTADAFDRYRAYVAEAEAKHAKRKEFLHMLPQLKIPNF